MPQGSSPSSGTSAAITLPDMCFFKKKKKEEINSLYKIGEQVKFRYRGELAFGWIYAVKKAEDGRTIYDVQLGGQCPAVLKDIEEDSLSLYKQN